MKMALSLVSGLINSIVPFSTSRFYKMLTKSQPSVRLDSKEAAACSYRLQTAM